MFGRSPGFLGMSILGPFLSVEDCSTFFFIRVFSIYLRGKR